MREVVRAGGQTSAYVYDKASRVVAVKHGDGSSESYAYGPDDTLVMAANAHSSVQFERDVLGRVLREVCGKQWVRSEYGVSGARIELSSSQGARQQISRNAMGDVLSVRAGGFEARFKRDLAGLELSSPTPFHRPILALCREPTGGRSRTA